MARSSRTGSDGSWLEDRLEKQRYKYVYAAENVIAGPDSPPAAYFELMKNDVFTRNMTNKSFQDVGIYVCEGVDGRFYWTQTFGSPLKAT